MALMQWTNVVDLEVMDMSSLEPTWTLIGSGKFGQVWKVGHRQGGFDVAVKILGPDNGRSNKDLIREARSMQCAECPYVMTVMGVFRGLIPKPNMVKVSVGLVMELMERGSLTSLQDKLKDLPPWPLVFRLAHQVAQGMNHLHTLTPALIHKDLKPDNILLDSELNVKITDFGLARFVNTVTTEDLKGFGTGGFVPPEASSPSYKANCTYDVYSYAMVLWSLLKEVKITEVPGLEELVQLMERCRSVEPDKRPTFTECTAVTKELYEKHKSGINDAVHKVQQELDCVQQDCVQQDLKELRDMLKEMKDKMAEMESRSEKATSYGGKGVFCRLLVVGLIIAGLVAGMSIAGLCFLKYRLETLEPRLAAMEPKLEITMKKMIADQPKVAFSAGLDGHVAGDSSDTTVVYKNVITNIGNAYNTATGVFVAPAKGVYYFRFTAAGRASSEDVRIMMFKNDQRLIYTWGYNNHVGFEYVSNGAVLEMEQNDTVYMRLPIGSRLYDNGASYNDNTFSGFLLYPLYH